MTERRLPRTTFSVIAERIRDDTLSAAYVPGASRNRLTRRTLLQTAATTAFAAPFVHGAYAAGKLAIGFWDHWVPGANNALTKLCQEWAAKEKVDIPSTTSPRRPTSSI